MLLYSSMQLTADLHNWKREAQLIRLVSSSMISFLPVKDILSSFPKSTRNANIMYNVNLRIIGFLSSSVQFTQEPQSDLSYSLTTVQHIIQIHIS